MPDLARVPPLVVLVDADQETAELAGQAPIFLGLDGLVTVVVTTGFFVLWAYAFRARRRDRDPGPSGSAQPKNVS